MHTLTCQTIAISPGLYSFYNMFVIMQVFHLFVNFLYFPYISSLKLICTHMSARESFMRTLILFAKADLCVPEPQSSLLQGCNLHFFVLPLNGLAVSETFSGSHL